MGEEKRKQRFSGTEKEKARLHDGADEPDADMCRSRPCGNRTDPAKALSGAAAPITFYSRAGKFLLKGTLPHDTTYFVFRVGLIHGGCSAAPCSRTATGTPKLWNILLIKCSASVERGKTETAPQEQPQFTFGAWLRRRREACGPEHGARPADIFKCHTPWIFRCATPPDTPAARWGWQAGSPRCLP